MQFHVIKIGILMQSDEIKCSIRFYLIKINSEISSLKYLKLQLLQPRISILIRQTSLSSILILQFYCFALIQILVIYKDVWVHKMY